MEEGMVKIEIVWIEVRNEGIKIGFRRKRIKKKVKSIMVMEIKEEIKGGIKKIKMIIKKNIEQGMKGEV